MERTLLRYFRYAGLAEGVSFLLLLLIAMPLKYIYGLPEAVKYTGWAHGVLFVLYIALAYYAKVQRQWPLQKFALAVMAAFMPLGTFFFDRVLRKEELAMQTAPEPVEAKQ